MRSATSCIAALALVAFFGSAAADATWQGRKLSEYLDFLNNYTSMIHGHANPVVAEAVRKQLEIGTCFAMPTESEIVLAELLGGRAHKFDFGGQAGTTSGERAPAVQRPAPLDQEISETDQTTHAEFVETLGEDAIWSRYA